jgi:uncharacterized membrane protein YgdD (TMEM256/DUF423 family)
MTIINSHLPKYKMIGFALILLSILIDALTSHDPIYIESLTSLQLATKYQLFSGLFLLLVAWNQIYNIGLAFITFGVLVFSLSIESNIILGTNLSFITPLGGAIMILGWLIFIFCYFNDTQSKTSD